MFLFHHISLQMLMFQTYVNMEESAVTLITSTSVTAQLAIKAAIVRRSLTSVLQCLVRMGLTVPTPMEATCVVALKGKPAFTCCQNSGKGKYSQLSLSRT